MLNRVLPGLVLASAAWANYPSQISKRLDVNAATFTITNSGTGAYSSVINVPIASGQRSRLTISVNDIEAPPGSTYTDCADPCSIPVNLNWGDTSLWLEILDGSGNPLSPRKWSKQVIPQVMLPCSAITFPIEVIGQQRYKKCVQFSSAALASNGRLHLRVNNSGYQQLVPDSVGYTDWSTKMAYQICQGADRTGTCTSWVQVNNTNTTAEDGCKWFAYDALHCIAGYAQTIEISVAVPDNALANSTNNITFRFNGTDGITSGFRILEFAILDSATQKNLTQMDVSSNVAQGTCSSSCTGFTSGDDVFIQQAPGMRGRFNGLRHVISKPFATTFTFAPCGSGAGFYAISGACTSPNGTYKVPVTQASGAVQAVYPQTAQQAMYVTKVVAPAISTLAYDDPTTWTAGSGNASNGHTLFTTATLVTPHNAQFAIPNVNNVGVHCSSCHTDDTPWGGQAGMDLKYFNFSNWSIKQRSIFHGLTESQADDVVAYIRGITTTVPSTARPWSPVQMPAPTADSLPLTSWDAGAGLDTQVMYDCDLGEYLTGVVGCTTGISGGSFVNWDIAQRVNLRELPMQYQPLPWNAWLPTVHPKDAFPDLDFYASTAYTHYTAFVTAVTAQTSGSYTSALANLDWNQQTVAWQLSALDPKYRPSSGSNVAGYWRPDTNLAIYSLYQWSMVKLFEVMHPTLEGFCSEYYTTGLGYGARPSGSYDSRCWAQNRFWFNFPYHISTDQTHHTTLLDAQRYSKPTGQPGATNDSIWAQVSEIAYLQSSINSCNYHEVGQVTRDIGYYHGFAQGSGTYTPGVFYSLVIPYLSSAQCGIDYAITDTPGTTHNLLRSFGSYDWGFLSAVNWIWTSASDQTTLFTKKAVALQTIANSDTVAHWRTFLAANGDTCSGAGRTSAWGGTNPLGVCDNLAGFLTIAKYFSADNTVLTNLATWGNSIVNGSVWTGFDFTGVNALGATASPVDVGGGVTWPKGSNMP